MDETSEFVARAVADKQFQRLLFLMDKRWKNATKEERRDMANMWSREIMRILKETA